MYTVSKGPSKIVAKTRRGLTQNYEKFETIKESGKRNGDLNSPEKNNVPRPVFQPIKKSVVPAKVVEETVLSPQHEEIIRYINDSWNIIVAHNPYDTAAACKAASQADRNNNSCSITNHMSSSHSTNLALNTNASASIASAAMNGNCSSSSTVTTTSSMYCIEPPSPVLSDFKPFDLESWWGRRLFNNITKSL